ncbi:hypothetical protein F2P81_007571 [Scophthalmus maximus]|uniref:Uncharacterized protein n=1 Tax=Scophthalmus maximus TaxID=52904 RepID=A0A6A4SVR8_SCOMX|nr:hypothetical protein F2P81_007571 [Scophthalmus maximus]
MQHILKRRRKLHLEDRAQTLTVFIDEKNHCKFKINVKPSMKKITLDRDKLILTSCEGNTLRLCCLPFEPSNEYFNMDKEQAVIQQHGGWRIHRFTDRIFVIFWSNYKDPNREVEVVPALWVNGEICQWPVNYKLDELVKAIRSEELPGHMWDAFNVRTLYSAANYKTAHLKPPQAETQTDLQTAEEDDEVHLRKKRRKKQLNIFFESDSDGQVTAKRMLPPAPNELLETTNRRKQTPIKRLKPILKYGFTLLETEMEGESKGRSADRLPKKPEWTAQAPLFHEVCGPDVDMECGPDLVQNIGTTMIVDLKKA